MFVQSKLFF